MEIFDASSVLTNDQVTVSIGEYDGVVCTVDNKPYIGRVSDVDDDIHSDFMAPYVKENSLSQNFQWPPRSDNIRVKKKRNPSA